jgi:nuclear transport factor 2 (NTF2) superfamily protein
MKWKRCYGLEDWTFADDGKMRKRQMSGNDVELSESGESLSVVQGDLY